MQTVLKASTVFKSHADRRQATQFPSSTQIALKTIISQLLHAQSHKNKEDFWLAVISLEAISAQWTAMELQNAPLWNSLTSEKSRLLTGHKRTTVATAP